MCVCERERERGETDREREYDSLTRHSYYKLMHTFPERLKKIFFKESDPLARYCYYKLMMICHPHYKRDKQTQETTLSDRKPEGLACSLTMVVGRHLAVPAK